MKEKLDELTTAQDILKEKEEELDKQKKELSDTQVYILENEILEIDPKMVRVFYGACKIFP